MNLFDFPFLNEASSAPEAVGIPEDWDIWHTLSPSGNLQRPRGGRPVLLAGTFNKILSYISGIYGTWHSIFRQSLKNQDWLVVCGYGFGDKGINSQIVEWMYQSSEKRLTIIHRARYGRTMPKSMGSYQ